MKKIFTLLLFIFSICIYSQNRYSEVSTSEYIQIEYNVYKDHYNSKSEKEKKIMYIQKCMGFIKEVIDSLNQDFDNKNIDVYQKYDKLYIDDIMEVIEYYSVLEQAKNMNLDTAETYTNEMMKGYNKAVKNLMKRKGWD